ncbi:hypothetical protein GCM10027447_34270 [Glycomyces halotolerans]
MTVAVWTQFLTAAVIVLTAIGMFAVQGAVEDEIASQLANDPAFEGSGITADDASTLVTVTFAAVAVVYIIFAAFYVVLGLLNNRGNRPARILSWILSGIALACCGFGGLIGQVGSTTLTVNETEYEDQMTQAVEEATPMWVTTLEWISLLLFIVGSLLIIILLALPASNDFFRKEEPQQQFPGQGPYPGQQPPPYGQQPPDQGPPPQQPPQ